MAQNSLLRAGGLGIIGALILVFITFLIADAVSGPLSVTPPGGDGPEALAIGDTIVPTVLGGLIGVGLAALTRRFFSNPSRVFIGICIAGLILYGIAPFSAAEETATAIWLNVMHIAAAIPIVGLLSRWLDASQAPDPTT